MMQLNLFQFAGRSGADEKGSEILDALVFTVVSPNSKLELEDGRTLEFIRTATSRWPDMFCVHFPSEGLLFSSKLFSAIVAPTLVSVYKVSNSPY